MASEPPKDLYDRIQKAKPHWLKDDFVFEQKGWRFWAGLLGSCLFDGIGCLVGLALMAGLVIVGTGLSYGLFGTGWEGSAAMLIFSLVFMFLMVRVFGVPKRPR